MKIFGLRLWDRRAGVRIAILIGSLSIVCAVVWLWLFRMPGKNYRGALPSLQADERALVQEVRSHVATLARDIGERNWRRPAALTHAATYISKELSAAGYVPVREEFPAAGEIFSNIVAEKTGQARPDEVVVVGAHYDSAEDSPGANDNATGVAAVLSLARSFSSVHIARTLRLVAFVNEEPPFFQTEGMGSLVTAGRARTRGDHIVAMMSLESLGCYFEKTESQRYPMPFLKLLFPDRGNFIAFVARPEHRALVHETIGAFRAVTQFPSEGASLPDIVPGVAWSDHWSFANAGYPAVMITDTAPLRDPAYHTGLDNGDQVDYDRLARVVAGIRAVVLHLVEMP